MTPAPRRATVADLDDLLRLRLLMRSSATGPTSPGRWESHAEADLRERLAEPGGDLAAVVVDGPDGRPVAAAIGVVHRLPAAGCRAEGARGWVCDLVTEPVHRRRGIATALMTELIAWFRASGVTEVELNAAPDAVRLYERLGFAPTLGPAHALTLTP